MSYLKSANVALTGTSRTKIGLSIFNSRVLTAFQRALTIQLAESFDEKIYVSSSDEEVQKRDKPIFSAFSKLGYSLDIRDFKLQRVFVPETGQVVNRKVQAEVDVAIAIKMVELAETKDHIVLIAGDRDFKDAIAAVRARGKKVTLIGF